MTGATKRAGVVRAPHGEVDLRLLASFRLQVVDGAVLACPPSARRLVALLALRGPLARAYAAGVLWPGVSEQHAQGSLRTVLWRLNALPCPLVQQADLSLALSPTVSTDVSRLSALAQALAERPHDLPLTPSTCRVSGHELLPGWYDEWIGPDRERVRQLQLHLLEDLARELLVRSRYAEALASAMTAVQVEPLRESAHRLVILVHLAEGNLGEAVRQLRACTELFERGLGVAPSPGLRLLIPPARTGSPRRPVELSRVK